MRKYRLAVTALLALFALGAAGFLFSSVYARFDRLARQARQEAQAAFRQQEEEFAKLSAEHADWRGLPGELRKFRSQRIIGMDGFEAFRRELNSCLDNNGFRGTSVSFQFGASQNRMRKVTISFTLNGGYRELKKFVFDMERSPTMHFFERIILNGGGQTVTGGFTMEAYLGE